MKSVLYLAIAFFCVILFVLPDLPFVQSKILTGTWIAGAGTLSEVRVTPGIVKESKKLFTTELMYSYEYDGHKYLGSDIEQRDEMYPGSDSLAGVQHYKLSKYPLQSLVGIKLSIDNPAQSYVLKLHERDLLSVIIGIVLCILFLFLAFRAFKRARVNA